MFGPDGLRSIASTQIDATGALTNLDAFAEAIAESENVGGTITSFVASPTVALTLSQLKQYSANGSNVPLLGVDPTRPTQRLVQGVPLVVSPAVGDDVIWAIPRAYAFVVLREDVTLDIDSSAYFTSDRIAVRSTMRVGFGWPHPASVVRITLSDSS